MKNAVKILFVATVFYFRLFARSSTRVKGKLKRAAKLIKQTHSSVCKPTIITTSMQTSSLVSWKFDIKPSKTDSASWRTFAREVLREQKRSGILLCLSAPFVPSDGFVLLVLTTSFLVCQTKVLPRTAIMCVIYQSDIRSVHQGSSDK